MVCNDSSFNIINYYEITSCDETIYDGISIVFLQSHHNGGLQLNKNLLILVLLCIGGSHSDKRDSDRKYKYKSSYILSKIL
jgi:hypothetical protein